MIFSCFVCRKSCEEVRCCANCSKKYCEACYADYSLKISETLFECVRCSLIYSSPLGIVVCELSPVIVERAASQGRSTISLPLPDSVTYDFDTVEVRCLKLDSRGAAIFGEQTWPDNFRLACAGSGYVLTEGVALKPTLSLKKRKDSCYLIGAQTFQKIVEKNVPPANRKLYLDYDSVFDDRNSFARDAGKIHYAVCVVGVNKLRFDALLDSPLVQALEEAESRAYFKTLLSHSSEEVAVAGLKLEILCKITLTRPEHPVRGNNCQHISCFSLKSFYLALSLSEHRKVYCPLCQRSIQFYLLDRVVERIIATAPPDADSVVVNELGELGAAARPPPPERKLAVMEVSESDEDRNREHVAAKGILGSLGGAESFEKFLAAIYHELATRCTRDSLLDALAGQVEALRLDCADRKP